MSVTIAIANHKGGVGKTTTAVNLAHGLAQVGYRVLLVDLDTQGHVAISLGMPKAPSLAHLLMGEAGIEDVIVPARPNLDVIRSNATTEVAKRFIIANGFSEGALLDALTGAATRRYDVIAFDTAPSCDVLHMAALVATDFMIVPTKLDGLALDGVKDVLATKQRIERRARRSFAFAVLPTFFERRTAETLRQYTILREAFGDLAWPPIPQDTRARVAADAGQTLWEFAPRTAAMFGYVERDERVGGYARALERVIAAMQ